MKKKLFQAGICWGSREDFTQEALLSSDLPIDSGKKKEVFQAGELHLHRRRGVGMDVKLREIYILNSWGIDLKPASVRIMAAGVRNSRQSSEGLPCHTQEERL